MSDGSYVLNEQQVRKYFSDYLHHDNRIMDALSIIKDFGVLPIHVYQGVGALYSLKELTEALIKYINFKQEIVIRDIKKNEF